MLKHALGDRAEKLTLPTTCTTTSHGASESGHSGDRRPARQGRRRDCRPGRFWRPRLERAWRTRHRAGRRAGARQV